LVEIEQQHSYAIVWNPDLPNSRFDLRNILAHPRVEGISYRVPLYRPQDQVRLPMLARRLRLDLFHVPYFAAPLLLPCPLVLTIHDLIFDRYPAYMPQRWARGYYRAMTTAGLRRARGVLAVSEATSRDLQAYYRLSPDAITVTPLAAEAAYRPADPTQVAVARRRYNLPEHFILSVGTRRPHKNIGSVVRAFGRIRDKVRHALVLIGEPDRRFPDGLPALIAREGLAGRVIDAGPVAEQDLPAIYSAADVLAFPSLVEGFGLPVLEAMSCGLPVVTSRCSSIPEVAGDAAILVDPTDDEALAAALLRVVTEPGLRGDLRTRGLMQAARFSWQNTARQTLGLYQRTGAERYATAGIANSAE
jgi:glycosyltransferase involved in cell wall biosynthesis